MVFITKTKADSVFRNYFYQVAQVFTSKIGHSYKRTTGLVPVSIKPSNNTIW